MLIEDKDYEKAAYWYGLAAEQGNQDAKEKLEEIASLGSEIKPTP